MQITYEVELDYGDEGPNEGEATPEGTDIATAVRNGLQALGFPSADVSAHQL